MVTWVKCFSFLFGLILFIIQQSNQQWKWYGKASFISCFIVQKNISICKWNTQYSYYHQNHYIWIYFYFIQRGFFFWEYNIFPALILFSLHIKNEKEKYLQSWMVYFILLFCLNGNFWLKIWKNIFRYWLNKRFIFGLSFLYGQFLSFFLFVMGNVNWSYECVHLNH